MANGFAEAPASWNVRYRTAEGFDAQLTLRGESGADLLPKTQVAIAWLQEHGAEPTGRANGSGNPNAPLCPTHQKPMKPSKHGGYFCPVKVADDDGTGRPVYCKQKIA